MAQHHHHYHHHRRPFHCALLLLLCAAVKTAAARSSQISELKSKISGVEELLEEFRQQLQQDQAYTSSRPGVGVVVDTCLSDFTSAEERIIRAKASIEQGAAFLSVPARVYSRRDCLHACCAEPHCTLAVVQEDLLGLDGSEEGLHCYLFNCTYRGRDVCSFTPQPGFSTYGRGGAGANATAGRPSSASAPVFFPSSGGDAADRRANDDDPKVVDEPPRSDAGQDVIIQLPTDWAVLDGRDSLDDYGISRYEWTLVKGEPSISMKVTHPGLLKISGLRQGDYSFQMTVTDTAGQKSSDNVSVSVLAPERHPEVCTGHCSHYQFLCDDGCCIDIDYACDGKQHCPDRSDEDFCPKFDSSRKAVTHAVSGGVGSHNRLATSQMERPGGDRAAPQMIGSEVGKTVESIVPRIEVPPEPQDRTKVALPPPVPPPAQHGPSGKEAPPASQDPCAASPIVGPCKGTFPRWYYDREAGECKHFLYGGCQGNHNNFLQESDCVNECIQKGPIFKPSTVPSTPTPTTKQSNTEGLKEPITRGHLELDIPVSKPYPVKDGHPVPESGAILPLALGLIITTLLLLMIGCRLRLVRHKLKKTRPLTTEESDYLINGMYL
ncbi:Low-density lipoprotein receptor-related protein 11 [Merluccius polli]|uniref:Low-density lipoprotein receptor-related protein 11 n=1 Tax=Merluccius polli TaxID=89951 RepID=A0AA47N4Q1_MERPO|nr:Low-density lipoprotein receptor-related protein 11 [Merluccius polli]